jgi:hypothetical protein
MVAYNDTSKAEFRVAGTLAANGTGASPITFTSTGAGAGAWYGINFLPTAVNSSLKRAVVNEAVYALWNQATAGTNTFAFDTLTGSSYGVYVTDGQPTMDAITSYSNQYGFYYTGPGGGSIISSIAHSNSADGIYVNSTGNVTLNDVDDIDPKKVLRRIRYHHPVYTPDGVAAQKRRDEINGARRTWFCGAYWGYGFHEDGVKSALAVAAKFGKSLDDVVRDATPRAEVVFA